MIEPIPWSGIADPISALSHLLGALVFAVLGFALVQRGKGNRLRVASLTVYVTGVVSALLASGLLHLVEPNTELRETMRRVDHATIFFLIAATYTPIHIIQFKGLMRWGVLTLVWIAAVMGIVVKTVFFAGIPEWVGLLLYLGLGWSGIFSAIELYRATGLRPLQPLIAGALFYTTGAVLDFLNWPVLIPGILGPHELFHVLVLSGVASHWEYIRRITIYAPITDLYRTE